MAHIVMMDTWVETALDKLELLSFDRVIIAVGSHIEVLKVTAQHKLCGSLRDLRLASCFGVRVIAVERQELALPPTS